MVSAAKNTEGTLEFGKAKDKKDLDENKPWHWEDKSLGSHRSELGEGAKIVRQKCLL